MALKMCLDLNIRNLEAEGDSLTLANEGIKQRTNIFLMNDVSEFAEAMVEVDRRWIEALD
ncbi:hypothetical protein Goklo_001034 [Gossypium klotzschianum]|uniref:Uncharacterized protein n=1 Tax=Gossypium klotzschianum TaxID=34286 RepID=A0A7J8VZ83_9ROSI|nr:hypothetical protein [Gossypium klotzschianum]